MHTMRMVFFVYLTLMSGLAVANDRVIYLEIEFVGMREDKPSDYDSYLGFPGYETSKKKYDWHTKYDGDKIIGKEYSELRISGIYNSKPGDYDQHPKIYILCEYAQRDDPKMHPEDKYIRARVPDDVTLPPELIKDTYTPPSTGFFNFNKSEYGLSFKWSGAYLQANFPTLSTQIQEAIGNTTTELVKGFASRLLGSDIVGKIENSIAVRGAISKIQNSSLDIFKYGLDNFDNVSPETYDKRVLDNFFSAKNELKDALSKTLKPMFPSPPLAVVELPGFSAEAGFDWSKFLADYMVDSLAFTANNIEDISSNPANTDRQAVINISSQGQVSNIEKDILLDLNPHSYVYTHEYGKIERDFAIMGPEDSYNELLGGSGISLLDTGGYDVVEIGSVDSIRLMDSSNVKRGFVINESEWETIKISGIELIAVVGGYNDAGIYNPGNSGFYDPAFLVPGLKIPNKLKVMASSGYQGRISGFFGEMKCYNQCGGLFEKNSTITLKAHANIGYRFSGWSGDCKGINDCILGVDKERSVKADFIDTVDFVYALPFDKAPDAEFLGALDAAARDLQLWYSTQSTTRKSFNYSIKVIRLPHNSAWYSQPWINMQLGMIDDFLHTLFDSKYYYDLRSSAPDYDRLLDYGLNIPAVMILDSKSDCSPQSNSIFSQQDIDGFMGRSASDQCGRPRKWTRCQWVGLLAKKIGEALTLEAPQECTDNDINTPCPSNHVLTDNGFLKYPNCMLDEDNKYFLSSNPLISADMAQGDIKNCSQVTRNALVTTVSGKGSVSHDQEAVSCSDICSVVFDPSTTITLTATPDPGYVFSGWKGACSGNATTCSLTMDSAKNVVATFSSVSANLYPLTVSRSSYGVISSSPDGIRCGGSERQCQGNFSSVTLTATPLSGYYLYKWMGCPTPKDNICSFTLSTKTRVTPVFARLPRFALKITKSKNGEITSDPAGLKCKATSTSCTSSFIKGTRVTLKPIALSGFRFGGWSGACTGKGSCQVTMDAQKQVGARFE